MSGKEKGRKGDITDIDRLGKERYSMPRTARSTEAGMVYHVLNRGNGRMRLFHKAADYEAFERAQRLDLRI